MDPQSIKDLFGLTSDSVFTIGDMLVSMSSAGLLSLLLSWVYSKTHSGPNYSRTFLISLFVMSVSTSVVMLIIGSNIARAFSLVGALSIIRFRTAVKDPRDTAFLFAGIVAGMGCGTGFFVPAFLLILFLSISLFIVDRMELGKKDNLSTILKITTDSNADQKVIESELEKVAKHVSQINQIEDYSTKKSTLVYSILPKRNESLAPLKEALSEISGVHSVGMYQADQHAPF
ncbi:MAG: DUF4956 domain-containing protein [Bdellovibrionales bacterium]|nr:DUF4956 domain-containing protein [Bdellovibrionales bacterium]